MGRGRPFRIDWRAEDTPERLHELYRAERDAGARTRLQGLWLLRTGRRLGEVATVLGVHYRTVQQWAAWYRAGGVAAVRARRRGGHGQPARLSPEQQAEVAAQVATGRFRTAREVRAWIVATYGVEYRRGIYDLLERLRCRPKVPRPLHVKADLAAQERWKKGA